MYFSPFARDFKILTKEMSIKREKKQKKKTGMLSENKCHELRMQKKFK